MNFDVPKQVLRSNMRAMRRWGADPDAVLAKAGVTANDVAASHPTDWNTFASVMNAFGNDLSTEDQIAFGEEYVHAFPGFRALAATFVSPRLLLRTVATASPLYWPELVFTLDVSGSHRFELSSALPPGCASCPLFFASAVGMFRGLPLLVGPEPATITVHELNGRKNAFQMVAPRSASAEERARRLGAEVERAASLITRALGIGASNDQRSHENTVAATIFHLTSSFSLTVAEARLTRRLAAGGDVRDAARELGMSYETARGHVKKIYAKLDVGSRAELQRRVRVP